ncbi:hypothetical protein [Streptomyces sp. NPDC090057]|uniref:hypothetical protein n=1 Tax=Streptomyces sp. NPDC090057 TaxID=3365935 RepID=UPI0038141379
MDSSEYDEYDAVIRVPKGADLAKSRKTAGAHRGLARDPDTKKLSNAEIFLKDESEADSPAGAQSVLFGEANGTVPNSRARDRLDPEEWAELLVFLAEVTVKAAPHVRKWLSHQALPFLKSTRNRISRTRKAESQAAPTESTTLIEPAATEPSQEVISAPNEQRASMSSAEAQERFIAALMARALSENAKLFSEEQMRVLLNARIEDEKGPVDPKSVMETLTPEQVEERISLILEANPVLLDELKKILTGIRGEGGYLRLESEAQRGTTSD